MCLALFVQFSNFIIVVFLDCMSGLYMFVCIFWSNALCCDALDAEAVSMFMSYDASNCPMQLSANLAYVKYMDPLWFGTAWDWLFHLNFSDVCVGLTLVPYIGPDDTKIQTYIAISCAPKDSCQCLLD